METNWIHNPKTDPEHFINQFMIHAAAPDNHSERTCELFRMHFRDGYCWHFAHILKAVFNRGEVCWAAPFGHMIWLDEDNTPYDIEGIYNGEAMYFIPEKYIGDQLHEFRHIHGKNNPEDTPSTADDLKRSIKNYCNDTGKQYHPEIDNYFCK